MTTTILSEPHDEGFLFWVLHVKGNVGDNHFDVKVF